MPPRLRALDFFQMNNVFIVWSVSLCVQRCLTFTHLCWNEAESRACLGYQQLWGISRHAQKDTERIFLWCWDASQAALGGIIKVMVWPPTHWPHKWSSGWFASVFLFLLSVIVIMDGMNLHWNDKCNKIAGYYYSTMPLNTLVCHV